MKEYRKSDRLAVPVQVEYQLLGQHIMARAFCKNISGGGLCFKSDVLYKKGEKVKTLINLDDGRNPVAIFGQVVWCRKEKVSQKTAYEVGVEYSRINPKDKERFILYFGEMMLNYFLFPQRNKVKSKGNSAGIIKKKKTILIIDDDRVLCRTLEKNLQKQGFETLQAHNGKEGLEIVRQTKIDLIILDVMMPVMDGLEFLQCIKIDEKEAKIPIIMLSVDHKNKNIENSLALQADFYLPKPFQFKNLIGFVQLAIQ